MDSNQVAAPAENPEESEIHISEIVRPYVRKAADRIFVPQPAKVVLAGHAAGQLDRIVQPGRTQPVDQRAVDDAQRLGIAAGRDIGAGDAGAGIAQAGDEVVLIGREADGEPTAQDWAAAIDTINYEIVTRLGPRVPRRYLGGQ